MAKTRLISPDNSTFLSPEILNSLCIVGNTHIPVISPEKILHHKRIEPLWQDQNNNRPIAHGHKSVANDTGMSFVPGIVCTVCVIIVLQVMDVLVKRARSGSRTILLYCIMFLWRYLPIKLSGVLVLAPRRCEETRCFIDRKFIIFMSGSEKAFRRDRM